MTAFQSWQPPYHAMCPQPGRDDLFLVILVNGFRMDIRGIDEWRYWWEHAGTLAQEHKVNIKVLPMTGSELMNFCGFKPEPGPLRPMAELKERDPEFYEGAIRNCRDVVFSDRASADQRREAVDLLMQMGAPLQ
ncbi:MAG: hypothetical protein KDE32_13010 [Novosphingobium sp.]|nr:hypothetical protein [Novosphingobium sp.]